MRAAYVMRLNMCIVVVVQVALLFGCCVHTTNTIHVVPRCSTVTTTIVGSVVLCTRELLLQYKWVRESLGMPLSQSGLITNQSVKCEEDLR